MMNRGRSPMNGDFLRNMASQLAARRAAAGGGGLPGAGMGNGSLPIGNGIPGLGGNGGFQLPGGGVPGGGMAGQHGPGMPPGGPMNPMGGQRPMMPGAGGAGMPPAPQGQGTFAPGWTSKLGAAFAPQAAPVTPNPNAAAAAAAQQANAQYGQNLQDDDDENG